VGVNMTDSGILKTGWSRRIPFPAESRERRRPWDN
jgi:hypothetical protein